MKRIVVVVFLLLLLLLKSGCPRFAKHEQSENTDSIEIRKENNTINVSEMMKAAFSGDINLVKKLRDEGFSCRDSGIIGVKGKDRQSEGELIFYSSPINAAAGEGHFEIVKFFIEQCDLSVDERSGHVKEFRYYVDDLVDAHGLCSYLESGSDIISKHIKSVNPLSEIGCVNGQLATSNVSFKSVIVSIFAQIIQSFVVDENTDVAKSPYVKTIEDIAHNRKLFDVVFGDYVKKIDSYDLYDERLKGKTALITASFHGKEKIVNYLLEKGADPNIKYGYGSTALSDAMYNFNYDIAIKLLKNGAKANIYMKTSSEKGVSPAQMLMPLFSCFPKGMEKNKFNKKVSELIPLLVDSGAPLEDLIYPLIKACQCNNIELAEYILKVGKEVFLKTEKGKDALGYCSKKGININ